MIKLLVLSSLIGPADKDLAAALSFCAAYEAQSVANAEAGGSHFDTPSICWEAWTRVENLEERLLRADP